MIVYANREREAATGALLDAVHASGDRLRGVEPPQHEASVDLLVAFGELETGVADALAPDADRDTAETRALRETSHSIGRLAHATWRGEPHGARRWRDVVLSAVQALDARALPSRVRHRVPEGYVYYSLQPEMYLEAARRFAAEQSPARVVCLGLRSIGASLSAVVAASVAEAGCPVRSYTLRPRGHPFERGLALAPALERELRDVVAGAHVLVVDEGPGLSGSSFAGVAAALARMGVSDERIVLFPSWQPDPQRFVSRDARERWGRHRSYVVPFEDVWLRNGRLARAFSAATLRDLSAGRWRSLLYESEAEHPAVHPQHERRKYLLGLVAGGGEPAVQLLKFAGLGSYGRSALRRSQAIADAGFGPRPRALRHGFLAMDFVRGRPLTPADASPRFLETAADYLAYVAASDASPQPVPLEPLLEMMGANVGEGLGEGWARALARLAPSRVAVASGRAVAVDGRMLPHEWLRSGDLFVKTDGVDHHDDHSFPGRQDVAWDVAGTVVEFELEQDAESAFVAACGARLQDPQLPDRLPFYRAAYLAYRIGYCTFAATSVDAEDRARFEALRERYAQRLRAELGRERPAA